MNGDIVTISLGATFNDNYLGSDYDIIERRSLLEKTHISFELDTLFTVLEPMTMEDNFCNGFDVVVKPETAIGRGSIIGSKSAVRSNISSYSVIAGNIECVVK